MFYFSNWIKILETKWGQVPLCNGRIDRAPHFGNFCFFLCYRCLGNLVGALVTCIILKPYEYKNNILFGIVFLLPTVIDHFVLKNDNKGIGNPIRFLNGFIMGIGLVLITRSALSWI